MLQVSPQFQSFAPNNIVKPALYLFMKGLKAIEPNNRFNPNKANPECS